MGFFKNYYFILFYFPTKKENFGTNLQLAIVQQRGPTIFVQALQKLK